MTLIRSGGDWYVDHCGQNLVEKKDLKFPSRLKEIFFFTIHASKCSSLTDELNGAQELCTSELGTNSFDGIW